VDAVDDAGPAEDEWDGTEPRGRLRPGLLNRRSQVRILPGTLIGRQGDDLPSTTIARIPGTPTVDEIGDRDRDIHPFGGVDRGLLRFRHRGNDGAPC
jgi:hypothetical protein